MYPNKIKIIVAEDHAIVREGIKQLIGLAEDLQVVGEAANGAAVFEVLAQCPCDVLLLDLSMPDVGGLDVMPRLRNLPQAPAVLVLSMHNEAQMAARALKAGAAGYATKDSEPSLLLTAIRKVANGARYIDPKLVDRMVFDVTLNDGQPRHSQLTEREFQVFTRLVQGSNVNDVAQQLAISAKTVSTHKVRLMQKLQVQSMAELVRYAIEQQMM